VEVSPEPRLQTAMRVLMADRVPEVATNPLVVLVAPLPGEIHLLGATLDAVGRRARHLRAQPRPAFPVWSAMWDQAPWVGAPASAFQVGPPAASARSESVPGHPSAPWAISQKAIS